MQKVLLHFALTDNNNSFRALLMYIVCFLRNMLGWSVLTKSYRFMLLSRQLLTWKCLKKLHFFGKPKIEWVDNISDHNRPSNC